MKHLSFIFSLLLVFVLGANSLRAQSITVVSPNGGETWHSFTTQTVQWMFTGMPPTVDIYLSTDNMVTWGTVATGIASGSMGGSHTITVPYANSNKCFIRVVNASMPSVRDSSNGAFTIVPPTITVVAPNGGETWNIGSAYNIVWNTTGMVSAVNIYETRDNGATWNTVQNNAPSGVGGGSYSWVIGGSPSTQCKIRITDFMYPPVGDTSNATFTIMTPMSISNTLSSEPLNVYPNPTQDVVTIETASGNYDMTVSDMTGKTIVKSNVIVNGGIITVNFSELPKGMYILRLQNAQNKVCIRKIEKM
jgi:hypothetical protein